MDDQSGGDDWSCKTCKAPVKLSPPTNQHPTFYRPDALPVAQPTVSKHWRKKWEIINMRKWEMPLRMYVRTTWQPCGAVKVWLVALLLLLSYKIQTNNRNALVHRVYQLAKFTYHIKFSSKLQSNRHHQQTNTQLYTDHMPFQSPDQQCQSTEGSTMKFTDRLPSTEWRDYSV